MTMCGENALQVAAIRTLNDQLRQGGTGGRWFVSSGLLGLSPEQRNAVLRAVSEFSDFNERNDPYGEHDCAIVPVGDVNVLWKIDYCDTDFVFGSPDPGDANQTFRVITVMLAEEY
ncbi:hypothetical protein DEVEQU_00468 [Devosia equisanguinis]|uniref:DUF3768 domain-containing protein n=1 Tax=Devosia equisanguinis TaxID=2490941 RepID=A0A447I790_9HYPH|nr:DUF3768 domain-containing protein [Devosia equisanguinis]VDS03347.1 hypothetical protein DEVEQU_00468 [Devosia equisanguinis]